MHSRISFGPLIEEVSLSGKMASLNSWAILYLGHSCNECFLWGAISMGAEQNGLFYEWHDSAYSTSNWSALWLFPRQILSWWKVEVCSTFTSLAYNTNCASSTSFWPLSWFWPSAVAWVNQMLVNAWIAPRMQPKRFSRENIMVLASDSNCGSQKLSKLQNYLEYS